MDTEEEKDERPPFRWNAQAMIIVAITAMMMALPFLGLLYFLRQGEPPAVAERPAEVDTAALAQGLERMSDAHFSSTVTIEEGVTLQVGPEDRDARVARVTAIAGEAGGSALEMTDAGDEPRRVMVKIPASRVELFKRAVRGDLVDFRAIPAGAASQVVEVELRAP